MNVVKRLYVDIETAPNVAFSWRVGRKIDLTHDNIITERSIITICYKWEDAADVKSLIWDMDKRCDKAILEKFIPVLLKADVVIGHNGDRFDLPWIRTRCLIHRIPIPGQIQSIDTLKMSKKFAFNSNRLDYLARIMGHGRKMETGGFGLWRDVYFGDKKALKTMVEYCKSDVRLLEQVHHTLTDYSPHSMHLGVYVSGFKHHCPFCASDEVKRNGCRRTTPAGTVSIQMKCKAAHCGRTWRMSENVADREERREHKIKQLEELRKKKLKQR